MYRVADAPADRQDSNVDLSASTADKADRHATVASATTTSTTDRSHSTGNPDTDTNTTRPCADSNMDLDSTADWVSVLPDSMDTSTAMWCQMRMHEMERYGNDQDWTSNMFDHIGQQMDAGLAFVDTVPSLLPWQNGDCSCLWSGLVKTTDHRSDMMAGKNSPDIGISQLSQLSNRLSSLHRWSCTVADNAERDSSQARHSSLINDVSFKSVASWVVHASGDMNFSPCMDPKTSTLEQSSTDNTLHNVFSASYQFMETLRGLYGESTSDSCTNTSSASSISTQDMQPVPPPPSGVPYSSIIERHLVIACHTLLLKIYVAVLISLQRDVDRRSSRLAPAKVDQDATVDASLADMRLVLIVQLCSYILERQHQAVSSYLAPESPPVLSQQLDISSSSQPTTITGAEDEPDSEVQRRLGRLRESLRI
ncbi:hypothetical protein BBP40_008255 [Aspergillus hancockii]|nr:hypothetical protein BBP40_008255 [Aspergillus hancockii]